MPGSLKCPERRVDGRICGKSFTTAWNLKRHMSGFHQAKPIFFIDCNSEASGEQSRARLDRLQFAPLRVQRWVSPATSSATGSSPQAVSTQSSSLLSPTSRSDCSSSRPSTTSSNRVRLAGLTLETRARELSAPDLSQEIFTPCNTPKTRFWNPIATQRGFEASSYNNLRPWEESSFDASRTSPPSDSAQVRQQVAGNDIKTPTPFEFGRAASHEFALEQRWPEIYRGASDEFTSSKSSASFESNSTPTPTYHLAQTSTNVSSSGKRPYTASDSGRVTPSPNGESEAIDNINPAPPKKPRWSDVIPHFGRSVRAGLKQPVPRYEVKLAKNLQQTHAVDWLTAMGKMAFEEKYMSLLSAWGVKPGHQGTCILCPEEWRLADPMDLFECLEKNNMPNALEQRATYSYAGHGTTLARALSWFVEWPRRGIELDNFLGFGPYQEVDGSHRCHQGFCIVHLVLEGTPTNHDRGKCREHAVTLRRLAKEIPEQCLEHDPPCLLQVRHLTRVRDAAQGLQSTLDILLKWCTYSTQH